MNKWKMALGAAVMTALLAGCGAQGEQSGAEALQGQQGGETSGAQQQGNGGGQPSGGGALQMGAPADLMGKVKSVDGQTITLYQSAMPMGQGNRPEGGQMPEVGERPDPPAEDGAAAEGGGPSADGEAAPPGGGGRMSMEEMFTEETVEVTVTEATNIVSVTFENEQMVEKELTLADLKADDILSIALKDETQDAETITVRTGGFGRGGRPVGERNADAAE
ncbi:hypothetical protein [Paenibacillus arenilitoris]|uniref:DUF5666 domain-containing protein n=1 Tax=Paenibacillus arenilitoris TaxID=2772299 RepID=A0A927CLY1_9BACL|nr:hypothetical protein [Paenibacillus arenilitoris]MBD2868045.1 hypothetical protein [Paenibacillus arenilitoris]